MFNERFFSALTKVYEKANSVVSYDVNCPNWLHKYIIGKKGSKLQNLMGDLQKQVKLRSILRTLIPTVPLMKLLRVI